MTNLIEAKTIVQLQRRQIGFVSALTIPAEFDPPLSHKILIDLLLPDTHDFASSIQMTDPTSNLTTAIIFEQQHANLLAQYRPLMQDLFGPNPSLYFVIDPVTKRLHLKVFINQTPNN